MSHQIDYDTLSSDLREILQKHGISPLYYGLSLTVSREVFEKISLQHEGYRSDFMLSKKGADWYVQIKRAASNEDLPPSVISESLPE